MWNGILWVLRTGAQWSEPLRRYPPYQTSHKWFQGWVRDGTFRNVLCALTRHLEERQGLGAAEVTRHELASDGKPLSFPLPVLRERG